MQKLYSTTNYEYLLTDILNISEKDKSHIQSMSKGRMVRLVFPDGELYHRFDVNDVENQDVVIIGGTYTAEETMELYDMGCAAISYGAKSLTLLIPYYGYSTMEREIFPDSGEIVKGKTRAVLISSIPSGQIPNKILLFDLHVEGLQYYFEGNVRPMHMYAKDIIIETCKSISDDFVLGSTDAGRAKWIESLAKDMNTDCAIITKRRTSGTETSVTSINANVQDRTVIIYDDMIRTGSSLIKAAEKYAEFGAKDIHVISTHGVLPGNSLSKIFDSKIIKSVTVTDSHPRANQLIMSDPRFKVKSIAKVAFLKLCRIAINTN